MSKRLSVRYSSAAREGLATLHRRRAGMLKQAITQAARVESNPRLIWVGTPMDVAACEAVDGSLFVYAVTPKRELLRKIWGPAVHDGVMYRRGERLRHGRGWPD